MEKELTKAKGDIAKAKEELESYKTIISEMEKDQLIKSNENFSIQMKDNSLIINGKEQPKAVFEKYRKYFRKNAVTIENKDGNFQIRN
jgi:hypothetical protein